MKNISVKLEEKLINDIKKICSIYNINFSIFIRQSIKKEINLKKQDFLFKMNEVEYCLEKEENEIIKILNKLSDDDLKIVERKTVKLWTYI